MYYILIKRQMIRLSKKSDLVFNIMRVIEFENTRLESWGGGGGELY